FDINPGELLAQCRDIRVALERLAPLFERLAVSSSIEEEADESRVIEGRERLQVDGATPLADRGAHTVCRHEIPRMEQMRRCISLIQPERRPELSPGHCPIPLIEQRYKTQRGVHL